MNMITSLENFKYNADEFIYSNNCDYVVIMNDTTYYLDVEKNLLYNSYNKIEITEEIRKYIIEKCLEDLPF